MIKTAVFPVAGRGTRMKPATEAVAKELLPVYDTPLIDFSIHEALAVGVERFVFVTSDDKPELEAYLRKKFAGLDLRFVVQDDPLGLGHAILISQAEVGDTPFAVLLPDDLIIAPTPVLAQMARAYDPLLRHHMVAAMEVGPDQTSAYGILDAAIPALRRFVPVDGLVEKPAPDDAPSRLAITGRYILHPQIFETLMTTGPGAGGEVQLTDALARSGPTMPVNAFRFEGVRFDCGRPEGLLEASSALQDAKDLTAPGRGAVA